MWKLESSTDCSGFKPLEGIFADKTFASFVNFNEVSFTQNAREAQAYNQKNDTHNIDFMIS